MLAHFNPPIIQDNPTGWGPCSIPEQFKDMPYQPFSKNDRLGKDEVPLRVISSIPS
ncbi:eukaryotic translation initiation factor 3 subunit D-like isoform X4 [Tachypleus tridentatus]|uniref:eukaryotic translation initiation factor 3 subunit D-like isoform X4 n=1 Tax=Tachypleus tridentatus TaxID=6853 RepID=UPI003FD178F4